MTPEQELPLYRNALVVMAVVVAMLAAALLTMPDPDPEPAEFVPATVGEPVIWEMDE